MPVLDLSGNRDSTASRQAYRALRRAIHRGDFVLGEIYSIGEIAKRLNISRTPVREAVCRLEAESLVDVLPQRGFRLRAISDAEIEEFFTLREMLESYVAHTLANRGDPSVVPTLRAMIDQQERSIEDDEEFLHFAEEIHIAMAELAGLSRVAWILNALRGQLWILGTHSILEPSRRLAAIAEHRAIIDCIARRDAVSAAQAIHDHLTNNARAQQAHSGHATSGWDRDASEITKAQRTNSNKTTGGRKLDEPNREL
jgi:GntR family transcriptional regulator, rspAB operon transcriptional repressor